MLIAYCVASAIGGGLFGFVLASIFAGTKVGEAIHSAEHWRGEFKRCAADLGRTCADRDEEKLRVDGLIRELDEARAALGNAQQQIADMQPLYDLGRRRQEALARQNERDRAARAAAKAA